MTIPTKALLTHTLVLGATGSGKTNLLHHLIAQDIGEGNSICILDIRGDLVSAVIEMAEGNVDPRLIRIIDLRATAGVFGFDPLFGAGESYFRALNVQDVIAAESDSWGPQLAETLRNALILLSESREPLTKLEDLFYDPAFLDQCIAACEQGPLAAYWERFADMSSEKRNSLAMPVMNKISLLLATDTLRRILGAPNPIDLGRHLDQKGSILLVSLAYDQLHSAGKMMGRMILSAICREIFARVEIPENRRNLVRLYVDEFEHFGFSEFEAILAEGRKYGLSLTLANQALVQLSPRLRSLILNIVGTKFILRCGREDAAALSKDITGDAKALNLTELPTGTAVLWHKGFGFIEIEINEPILRDAGARSARGRAFEQSIYDHSLPIIQATGERIRSKAEPSRNRENDRDKHGGVPTSSTTKPDMGDWLCD